MIQQVRFVGQFLSGYTSQNSRRQSLTDIVPGNPKELPPPPPFSYECMLNGDNKFRVFWDVAPCSYVEADRRFRGTYVMIQAVSTSETSISFNDATSQKTLNWRTENLKSHINGDSFSAGLPDILSVSMTLEFPSWNVLDHFMGKLCVAKQGKLGEKCPLILPAKYLCHTPQGSLTCRKVLRHGADGFTSPPKKSCNVFLSPLKKSIVLCQVWTRKRWSVSEHLFARAEEDNETY
jgi:hypothetical protein